MPKVRRTSARLDLEMEQGTTFYLSMTWKSGADEDDLTAVDLTDCTAEMQIRRSAGSSTIYDTYSTDNYITLGGLAGTVVIEVPASVTEGYEWTHGEYDLEITAADGTVRKLVRGDVTVFKEVTRDD